MDTYDAEADKMVLIHTDEKHKALVEELLAWKTRAKAAELTFLVAVSPDSALNVDKDRLIYTSNVGTMRNKSLLVRALYEDVELEADATRRLAKKRGED